MLDPDWARSNGDELVDEGRGKFGWKPAGKGASKDRSESVSESSVSGWPWEKSTVSGDSERSEFVSNLRISLKFSLFNCLIT